MASSMTGLGIGEVQWDGLTIVAEVKSVNNRFLEVSCRLPSFLGIFEKDARELIRSQIHRGKLYVTVTIQGDTDEVLDIRVDAQKTAAIRHLLDEICHVAKLEETPKLEHFLKFSEIFEPFREPEGGERTWEGAKKALTAALEDLRTMRSHEGKALEKDIVQRVSNLEELTHSVETLSKSYLPEVHEKMIQRLERLIQDKELDQDRLHAEVAIMADKMDVTEECVRLHSHHELFFHTLNEEDVVGKKLNFLLQEMNREANTISSKSSHAKISHLIVEMKEEIEKLREQVQNLE